VAGSGNAISPGKTKVVCCKDRVRMETYPEISFDFLGYTFSSRKSFSKGGELSAMRARGDRQSGRQYRAGLS
jgi:hypothetical protein